MQRIHVNMRASIGVVAASIALLVVFAVASPTAQALSGGAPANPAEAPWAVKITAPAWGGGTAHCTGSLVAQGLILTAGHCLGQFPCSPGVVLESKITLRFSDAKLNITKPASLPNRAVRHPGFDCRGNGQAAGDCCPRNDVGFLRFRSPKDRPLMPLASPPEVSGFVNRGVTLFAGGLWKSASKGWVYSSWVRKSKDGGLVMLPGCAKWAGAVCFRSAKSKSWGGDSGGPYVGWLGGWKQIAVVSGYSIYKKHHLNIAASLADPTIRGWVDQQIAAGCSCG